jgi:hypothetical protein
MKLMLKRDEGRKGMLGGKAKYTLVAKLELSAEEAKTVDHFNLQNTLLYSAEAGSEAFRQYGSTGGTKVDLFAKFLLVKKLPKITGGDLLTGLTFEDEFVLSIIEIQGRVIQAANVFDAAVKSAASFLGEASLDLPVV